MPTWITLQMTTSLTSNISQNPPYCSLLQWRTNKALHQLSQFERWSNHITVPIYIRSVTAPFPVTDCWDQYGKRVQICVYIFVTWKAQIANKIICNSLEVWVRKNSSRLYCTGKCPNQLRWLSWGSLASTKKTPHNKGHVMLRAPKSVKMSVIKRVFGKH